MGQLITYTFTVTNTGDTNLTDVAVNDTQISPVGDILESGPTCPSAPAVLSPLASVTCTATARVTLADLNAGGIFDSATATALNGQTAVSTPSYSYAVHVHQIPLLSIITTAGIAFYTKSGEVIPYSFIVSNNGNVTLAHIVVATDLKGLSKVSCPTTTLNPGQSTTCTARYITTNANVKAGAVVLTAIASGSTPESPKVTSAPSGALVPEIKTSVEVTG